MVRALGWISAAVAILGSLAVSLACGPRSMVDDMEMISLHGRALDGSGGALTSQRIRLMRQPTLSELLAFVGNPVALGAWCIAREIEGEDGCLTFRSATTDARGQYAIALTGAETQGDFGDARHLWVGTGASGATIGIGFYAMQADVAVPDVMLWTAVPTAADDGGDFVVRWPAAMVSPSDPAADSYSVEITDANGGPIWRHTAVTTLEARVDRRVTEDVGVRFTVAAESERAGSATTFAIVQTAPGGSAPAAAFRPASRGLACHYRNAAGTEEDVAPCPLTDGDFTTFFSRTGTICSVDGRGLCTAAGFEEIVIDVGTVRAATRVVVHATSPISYVRDDVQIDSSVDGIAWVPIAATLAPFEAHDVAAVRFVRLRHEAAMGEPADTALSQISNEISVE